MSVYSGQSLEYLVRKHAYCICQQLGLDLTVRSRMYVYRSWCPGQAIR